MKRTWLTCSNHPTLRWSADSDGENIRFEGETTGKMLEDNIGVECEATDECPCPPTALIMAPENDQIEDADEGEGAATE